MSESYDEYRVVSRLGDRYATPMEFESLEAAEHHLALHARLKGLPGMDTMLIQRRTVTVGNWEAV